MHSMEESTAVPTERMEGFFYAFLELLPRHFMDHHDIPFYADKLGITAIYLSRIVKQRTGRTVVDLINERLLEEASWLLRNTDMPIVQIAEHLHFADNANFTRFFSRLKGVTPKAYRNREKLTLPY